MIEQFETLDRRHNIQRYILGVLLRCKFARFRDLRPPKVDSNAFSYHLKTLLRDDFVAKTEDGYTLTARGLSYIDRVSGQNLSVRPQPKIMTIIALTNEFDELLVHAKNTQPFIGELTMPCGKLHLDDASIHAAAVRELHEKVGVDYDGIEHVGDCYVAVLEGKRVMMNALMHTFHARVIKSDIKAADGSVWQPLGQLESAAPATRRIAQLITECPGQHFFDEYSERLATVY